MLLADEADAGGDGGGDELGGVPSVGMGSELPGLSAGAAAA